MKLLIQRVSGARVEVAGEVVGSIDQGLLALVGIEPQDDQASLARALHKLLNYRVFSDDAGKMNRSLKDVGGGLLLVSQFTLAADTRAVCAPAFPVLPHRFRALHCSTVWSNWPEPSIRRSPPAVLARICRCIWSTMGR